MSTIIGSNSNSNNASWSSAVAPDPYRANISVFRILERAAASNNAANH